LARECTYVERSLKIERRAADTLPERVLNIYATLLSRDETANGTAAGDGASYAARRDNLLLDLSRRLGEKLAVDSTAIDTAELLRRSRRWLRENTGDAESTAGPDAGGHDPASSARRAMGMGQSASRRRRSRST
jgi:hypothetical protein